VNHFREFLLTSSQHPQRRGPLPARSHRGHSTAEGD
jgi:hypothetical protein